MRHFAFMMVRKMNFSLLFMTFTLVDRSFSVIWWTHTSKYAVPESDYSISRSASTYRGLVLAYSPSQKNEICNDLIRSQDGDTNGPSTAEDESRSSELIIADGVTDDGDQQHPLSVIKITTTWDSPIDTQDIFFKCVGVKYLYDKSDGPNIIFKTVMLSSAFRSRWMYSNLSSADELNVEDKNGFIGMSPDYIELNQMELETQYVTIRRNMSVLEGEFSKYVQLIETKDDLSELSAYQKFLLCASIIQSPSYRVEGLKFNVDSTSYNKNSFRYVEKPLSFKNENYALEKWTLDCIACEAYVNGANEEKEFVNVFLTRSYSNKDSVIALYEENKKLYLDKSFKNIPLLINVRDPATKGSYLG